MTTIIERHRADIEALCRSYRVKRLDVFGSAIREDFDPGRSDVDFLVEFESDRDLNTFHAYMGIALDTALEFGLMERSRVVQGSRCHAGTIRHPYDFPNIRMVPRLTPH